MNGFSIEFPKADSLLSLIEDSAENVLVISAPNFEERSLEFIRFVGRGLEKLPRTVDWRIVTLQGSNRYDILDFVKARNANRALEYLRATEFEDGTGAICHELPYPPRDGDIRHFLRECSEIQSEDYSLVIDASAIPRGVLWAIIRLLSNKGRGAMGFRAPRSIYVTYAWAKAYPAYADAENVGRIQDSFAEKSLAETIERSESVDAVLVTSGNSHLASRTLDQIMQNSSKRDVAVEVVNFIRPRGFDRSNHHMLMHQGLSAAAADNDRVSSSYVYHVEHAFRWFETLADKAFEKLQNNIHHTFILSPFGPKVLNICAQLVAEDYLLKIRADPDLVQKLSAANRLPTDCVSVLNAQKTQYLSTYSIGADGEITVLKFSGEVQDTIA